MSETSGMADNRCASCIHWQRPWESEHEGSAYEKADDFEPSRWGVCSLIRHPGRRNYTAEEAERYGWPSPVGPASSRAFTADGSDYLSELSTRDDFGCVEWAAESGRSASDG